MAENDQAPLLNSASLADLDRLVERDDILALFATFFDATRSDLAAMNDALESHQAANWKRASHRIAGAALSLGFDLLAQVARELEGLAVPSESKLERLEKIVSKTRFEAVSRYADDV